MRFKMVLMEGFFLKIRFRKCWKIGDIISFRTNEFCVVRLKLSLTHFHRISLKELKSS